MDEPIIGEIRLVAFDRIPAGWAACDGQVLSIDDHRALFDVIGARYGGDGRRTFALPDMRGRVAVHAGGVFPLGQAGGATRHALKVSELPSHSHELLVPATVAGSDGSGAQLAYDEYDEVDEWRGAVSTRAAKGHDNMQPYLGLMFMIALAGQAPPRN